MDAKVEELDEANRIDAEGSEETLHRQIHPNFVKDGRPNYTVFDPSPQHNFQLSVSRGLMISAAESWRKHTEQKKLKSCGVSTIHVNDCRDLSLPVYADPVEEPPQYADPAHALVDFRPIDRRVRKDHAKALNARATFTPMQATPQEVEEF